VPERKLTVVVELFSSFSLFFSSDNRNDGLRRRPPYFCARWALREFVHG
jgi:hypothetical protein